MFFSRSVRLTLVASALFLVCTLPLSTYGATDTAVLESQVNALTRYLDALRVRTSTTLAPLSTEDIRSVIESGVSWLSEKQEENGHFKYEYVPYEDRYRADDNIVRQAGAFFELGEVERLDRGSEYELEAELVRSASYFESLSREGSLSGHDFRCIVDGPKRSVCKLGATALALIGLISMVEEYPEYEREYRDLIEDYGEYILAMKKKDAGFRYYFYTESNRTRLDESSFSNGEALLALVRLYQYEERADVQEVIDDTFVYLSSEKVPFDTPLYLWAMAALKDMHALWPNPDYLSYAKEYTKWRVDGFKTYRRTGHNMCAYTEGVVSAYILLTDSLPPSELIRYREEIDFWLAKGKRLQLTEADTLRLSLDGGVSFLTLPNSKEAIGGFLTGHDELTERIDFTQHCISAYLQTLVEIEGESLR